MSESPNTTEQPETGAQVSEQAREIREHLTWQAFRAKQAALVPAGVATILAGVGIGQLGFLFPALPEADERAISELAGHVVKLLSKELLEVDVADSQALAVLLFLACLVVGLWLLASAKKDKDEFVEAHPYIDRVATSGELAQAKEDARPYVVAGWICAVVTAIVAVLAGLLSEAGLWGLAWLTAAAATWCLMRAFMTRRAPACFWYNCDAIRSRSMAEIAEDDGPTADLQLVLREFFERTDRKVTALWVAGIVVSAALFFLPTLETGWWWVPVAAAAALAEVVRERSQVRAWHLFRSAADRDAE